MKIKSSEYGFFRIAAISPDMKLGDIDYNVEKIKDALLLCKKDNVQISIFPELCLTGYTLGDLFYQDIIHKKSICSLIELKKFSLIYELSFVVGLPIYQNGLLFNSAALLSNGKILGIVPKTYLCNTNEYYEERWFSSEFDRSSNSIIIDNEEIPFGSDLLFKELNHNLVIGIEICEDLWSIIPPSAIQAMNGANIIFNLSSSNEYLGKAEYRKDLVKMHSSKIIAGYVYCSSGPNESSTDLVFSNHNILTENGIILKESNRFNFGTEITIADFDIDKIKTDRIKNNSFAIKSFKKEFKFINFSVEEINIDNIERPLTKTPFIPSDLSKRKETCLEIFNIQSTALARRLKAINCINVVIGISGGLDSTLALLVILKAFSKLNLSNSGIKAITMPGFGTTNRTKQNAQKLIKLFGADYLEISIIDSVLQHFKDIDQEPNKYDIVYENSQARERTQILMDYANKVNGIVIGTGDLSEYALGWCTFNGDQMSMYGVNSGVPKTLVKYIIETVAEVEYSGEIQSVLNDIINTPISPELIPAYNDEITQITEEEIGPYLLNDFFLYCLIRLHYSPKKSLLLAIKLFSDEFNKEYIRTTAINFYKRFFSQQFKRSAMPDGIKVGTVALSPRGDWRMPSDCSSQLWIDELTNFEPI